MMMAPAESIGYAVNAQEKRVRALYRGLIIVVCLICFATLASCAYIVYGQLEVLFQLGQLHLNVENMRTEVAMMSIEVWSNTATTSDLKQTIQKFDASETLRLDAYNDLGNRTKAAADETEKQATSFTREIQRLNQEIDNLNDAINATRKNSARSRALGESNRKRLIIIQNRAAPTPRSSGPKWFWEH